MKSTLVNRVQNRFGLTTNRLAQRWFAPRGYSLVRSGKGYIDAKLTIRDADRAGVSICEYLESLEDDERKRGRRDRILQRMQDSGCLNDVHHVTEIGTGTGMYLDRVMQLASPNRYEIFETADDWRQFLRRHVQQFDAQTTIHDADGHSLSGIQDGTSDLVHAHGVFVYLSTIETFTYLTEMARVCRPGGHVVFDWYFDTSFDLQTTRDWIRSGWRFPVLTPQRLAEEFYRDLNLNVKGRFTEVHGASSVDYEILQKAEG